MVHKVESEFWVKDIVFLKVNAERDPGMITAVQLCADGGMWFQVDFASGRKSCYGCELTKDFIPVFESEDN